MFKTYKPILQDSNIFSALFCSLIFQSVMPYKVLQQWTLQLKFINIFHHSSIVSQSHTLLKNPFWAETVHFQSLQLFLK